MSRCVFHVGDVFHHMAAIPDHSVDLIVTSPPFLALRSYLPKDHPDKHLEIGSEPTPAAYLTTLLALTREWRRILAPHGSICVELGDTYAGSGGAGGDYQLGGLREGQDKFEGSGYTARQDTKYPKVADATATGGGITNLHGKVQGGGKGWPLAKSLCLIPSLYAGSLAYGRNLLNPDGFAWGTNGLQPDTLDPWRVRNLIVWHRPNPPVGALGDKVRPSTSYITVACTSDKRWFDLDAERTAYKPPSSQAACYPPKNFRGAPGGRRDGGVTERSYMDGPGAPPLDCWIDGDDWTAPPTEPASQRTQKPRQRQAEPSMSRDGNWSTFPNVEISGNAPPLDCWIDGDVWTIPTNPYKGAHYATYPPALPRRLIRLMCPREVCVVCGEPRRRITQVTDEYAGHRNVRNVALMDPEQRRGNDSHLPANLRSGGRGGPTAQHETLGWSDCEHDNYRRGHVLDPFAGSGTTLAAAAYLGRDATGIDLDPRNLDLARERIGLFLEESA